MNLSLVATVLSVLATFPQLYRTVTTKVLRDLHPTTPIVAIVANILLAIHGYQINDVGILLFGSWFAMYNAILLSYMAESTPQPGL